MTDESQSLPIIDLAYRLTRRSTRLSSKCHGTSDRGLGQQMEEAAFDLLVALVKAP